MCSVGPSQRTTRSLVRKMPWTACLVVTPCLISACRVHLRRHRTTCLAVGLHGRGLNSAWASSLWPVPSAHIRRRHAVVVCHTRCVLIRKWTKRRRLRALEHLSSVISMSEAISMLWLRMLVLRRMEAVRRERTIATHLLAHSTRLSTITAGRAWHVLLP